MRIELMLDAENTLIAEHCMPELHEDTTSPQLYLIWRKLGVNHKSWRYDLDDRTSIFGFVERAMIAAKVPNAEYRTQGFYELVKEGTR